MKKMVEELENEIGKNYYLFKVYYILICLQTVLVVDSRFF